MNKVYRTRWGVIVLATTLTTSTVVSVPVLADEQNIILNSEYDVVELETGITEEQYNYMCLLSLIEENAAGISFAKEFIMEVPMELASLDLTQCQGAGTFAFANPAFIPEKGITVCELIFTPEQPEAFSYENIAGWNMETKAIHRFVQIYCTSLMTEEEKLAKAAEDAAKEASMEVIHSNEDSNAVTGELIMAPGLTVNPDEVPEKVEIPEAVVTPEMSEVQDAVHAEDVSAVPEATVTPEESVVPEENTTLENVEIPEATEIPETSEEIEFVINRSEAVLAVENMIMALGDAIVDDVQLTALLDVTRMYDSLSIEEKLALDMNCEKKLVDLQAAAAVYNHTCKGVAVSGNIPWYVALKVELDNDTEDYVPTGLETIVPYDISLWDMMNQVEFILDEGEIATLSMRVPENLDLYDGIQVVHYLNESVYELIEVRIDGEFMSFETASFSPFNVAGSNVLVGGTDKKPISTATPTPTPTATPTATPTPAPVTTIIVTPTPTPTATPTPSSTTQTTVTPTPTVKSSNNTNNSNKNNKTTAVKTGDEANTSRFLMLGMSAMAMMTAAGSIFVRRRKTEND